MKELNPSDLPTKEDNIELSQQQEVEEKMTLESTIVLHPGHTMFEIDLDTMEVRLPEYSSETVVLFDPNWTKNSRPAMHAELIRLPGCAYVSALNKKSALKKLAKGENGSKIDMSKTYLEL